MKIAAAWITAALLWAWVLYIWNTPQPTAWPHWKRVEASQPEVMVDP